MDNNTKYEKAFMNALQSDDLNRITNIQYRDTGWDSVAHMVLIAEIEDGFSIMLDTDDVIDFSSFEKGKEILNKYDIKF